MSESLVLWQVVTIVCLKVIMNQVRDVEKFLYVNTNAAEKLNKIIANKLL